MKSIYEASVVYGKEHQGTVNIEDFEAGANYVLEQISQALQGDFNSHSAFKLKTIKQIIEQLKK